MNKLWDSRNSRFCLKDVADQAEYERMLKRFDENEQRSLKQSLLFDGQRLTPRKIADREK